MRYIVNLNSNSFARKLKSNWEPKPQSLQQAESSTSSESSTPSTCSPEEALQGVLTRNEIVYVKWVDAQTSGGTGWQEAEDMVEAMHAPAPYVHTVGYLMHANEERIAVCDTIQDDGTAGGYVHLIPNGMLIELTLLGEVGEDDTCSDITTP